MRQRLFLDSLLEIVSERAEAILAHSMHPEAANTGTCNMCGVIDKYCN